MTLRADLAAAIAQGVEAESSIEAYSALRVLDPLLRLVARRRLGRLLERVNRETIDPHWGHRLRVAALLLDQPNRELDWDDGPAVLGAYAVLPPKPAPARRWPWFTLGVLAGAGVLIVGAFQLARVLAPFDPRRTAGGHVLGEVLGHFVAKTSNGLGPSALAEAKAAISDPAAERALGVETTAALKQLLSAATVVAASDAANAAASEGFFGGANALDARLHARRLPYFVDADVISRAGESLPLLMSFYVERESQFEARGITVRALDLWRLDTLGVRFGALGYTRPRTPAALVLLDQVESELVRSILPALPPGEACELVDDDTREQNLPWVSEVERTLGQTVRKHYAALSSDANVMTVGKLLARRRALVRRWRASIAEGGRLFHVPERLIPEADYGTELHLRVANEELYEWDELHQDLLAPANYAAFLRLREPYVSSIERHEVEHRLDFVQGFRPVPPILCKLLGLENALDAPVGGLQARASEELSAYLAQVAEASDSPVLELVVLSTLLLDQRNAGGAYWYASLALFEAVASELGIDPELVVGHGRLDRERIARLVLQVTAIPPIELKQAGARAYERAFGEPVPHVTRKALYENQAWRH